MGVELAVWRQYLYNVPSCQLASHDILVDTEAVY